MEEIKAMCHFKDASDQTLRAINRYAIMECGDIEVTLKITKLTRELSLLISQKVKQKS